MNVEQVSRTVERQNEVQFAAEPLITIRAKTQIVVDGIVRYMGEVFQLPEREGLGFVGGGEAEQVIDQSGPLWWQQNAPGPQEAPGGGLGSREKPVDEGQQLQRQNDGESRTTFLQPQQYDDFRNKGTAGVEAATGQWWREGATEGTGGFTPFESSPGAFQPQARQTSRTRNPGYQNPAMSPRNPGVQNPARSPGYQNPAMMQRSPQGGQIMSPQDRERMERERGERGERRGERGEERQEEKFFHFCERVIEEQQETIRRLIRCCLKCEEEDRGGDRDRRRRHDRDRDDER